MQYSGWIVAVMQDLNLNGYGLGETDAVCWIPNLWNEQSKGRNKDFVLGRRTENGEQMGQTGMDSELQERMDSLTS